MRYFLQYPALVHSLIGPMRFCQHKTLQRVGSPRVAVACWNTANNALGRAATLAEAYRAAGHQCQLIGCVPYPQWQKVWQPMQAPDLQPIYFELPNHAQLLLAAVNFVIDHPFEIVHLSKPRLPTIVLGLLYQQIWGAKVLIDIDDEELGFVAYTTEMLNSSIPELITQLQPFTVDDAVATVLSSKLVNHFSQITVSNPALQQRYGGLVVPHLRSGSTFQPSASLSQEVRKRFGLPVDKKIVLFAGTPRAHKGLLDIGAALASLNRNDYIFLVVGDFIDQQLLAQLSSIDGLQLKMLPNQPYSDAALTAALGDIVVLLQSTTSEAARFQLPAKLIDAMAMGLTVLIEPTPATDFIASAGVVQTTAVATLALDIERALNEQGIASPSLTRHQYFRQHLSIEAYLSHFQAFAKMPSPPSAAAVSSEILYAAVTNDIERWLHLSIQPAQERRDVAAIALP